MARNPQRLIAEALRRLMREKELDKITVQEIADAAGYGIATLYRYFENKTGLVLAVSVWQWERFLEENRKRRPGGESEKQTAADVFAFYLDSFLELYRKHKALLRFNQLFNIYIASAGVSPEAMQSYRQLIRTVEQPFHTMYLKAKEDRTLRTDVPEEEMFSATLHLMLAAVTRYAVGLAYAPEGGFDAEKELLLQKKLLFKEYAVQEVGKEKYV